MGNVSILQNGVDIICKSQFSIGSIVEILIYKYAEQSRSLNNYYTFIKRFCLMYGKNVIKWHGSLDSAQLIATWLS